MQWDGMVVWGNNVFVSYSGFFGSKLWSRWVVVHTILRLNNLFVRTPRQMKTANICATDVGMLYISSSALPQCTRDRPLVFVWVVTFTWLLLFCCFTLGCKLCVFLGIVCSAPVLFAAIGVDLLLNISFRFVMQCTIRLCWIWLIVSMVSQS